MANTKRKAGSGVFRFEKGEGHPSKVKSTSSPVRLVYFDPDDLRQLKKIDEELTVEFLRENKSKQARWHILYDILTK